MESRVLRYFLAVVREGNITAAANFLHLTQPTLSRQIKDLEDENRRLKQMFADLSLENRALKDVIEKKL